MRQHRPPPLRADPVSVLSLRAASLRRSGAPTRETGNPDAHHRRRRAKPLTQPARSRRPIPQPARPATQRRSMPQRQRARHHATTNGGRVPRWLVGGQGSGRCCRGDPDSQDRHATGVQLLCPSRRPCQPNSIGAMRFCARTGRSASAPASHLSPGIGLREPSDTCFAGTLSSPIRPSSIQPAEPPTRRCAGGDYYAGCC